MYDEFVGDREELWRAAQEMKIHIKNLEFAVDKPYFARLDFTTDDDGKLNCIYIGKNGIYNDTDIIVTDWRAPICSLYYEGEVGQCSYEAPEGEVTGNLSLKRQFEIENGELLEYYDVDLVSQDNLLQKYLNSNNDARLKSIVSTIQKEQNDVIRKKIGDNLIVQGVAGSGKTTVALHRIAYLVYNYMNRIKQNQYLVIGPNPVFLKYIKSVLPDLDVSGVKQNTYEQFVEYYIEEEIKINSSDNKAMQNITGKRKTDIDKFKCSMRYQTMISQFMKMFFYSITSSPLLLGNFEVIPKEIVDREFENTNNAYISILNNRIEITINRLTEWVQNNYDSISCRYSDYSHGLFKMATTDVERKELREKFSKEREEISKGCKSLIRKYFNKSKLSSTKLYKLFITSISDFDIYNYEYLTELKSETLKNIKTNSYDFEDLAALLYIKMLTSPNKEYNNIRHVVVDEAQDFGEFNFYILKKALPNATFSIFGDIAQSIYDYRGINSWDEVNSAMFENQGNIINFNKSYRTTAEIMDVADDIAESIGLGRSDMVVRHGAAVQISEVENSDNIPKYIFNKVNEYKEKGYKTIAIISKTNLLSNYINDDLSDLGMYIPNVSFNDDLSDDKFSVCTISNQLAKGLEFDAVIINGASEDIYSSLNTLDMKLLYVAITRALHELDIVYSGTITRPLEFRIKEKEVDESLNKIKNNIR